MASTTPRISATALQGPDLPLMLHFAEEIAAPLAGATSTTDENETMPLLDN